jgi:hypothetical protein
MFESRVAGAGEYVMHESELAYSRKTHEVGMLDYPANAVGQGDVSPDGNAEVTPILIEEKGKLFKRRRHICLGNWNRRYLFFEGEPFTCMQFLVGRNSQ